MRIFEVLFYVSVFLIFYSYVVFPVILRFLARNIKIGQGNFPVNFVFPEVSIIISVYNEELVIKEKIESILNSNYSKEKLEIIIGSDASDDRTTEIVRSYMDKYSNIKYFEYSNRRGKPSVINDLIVQSSNEIIILTDTNVFFEKQMIATIVKHFRDEKIGLVGANIQNSGMNKDGIFIQEKSYIKRENVIKHREGILWGCMMGPFGGCYAIRKNLFEKVPANFLVDDFYISMKIIEKNHSCINDLDAICFEDVSSDINEEYRRKSRIAAGNFQNLKVFSHFLWRPFQPAGFCFISHKFLRWMTPFFIIITLISLTILSTINSAYLLLLSGEFFLLYPQIYL